MGDVVDFPRPERLDPIAPDVVIEHYWDNIKRGMSEQEAAELAAVFWRCYGA